MTEAHLLGDTQRHRRMEDTGHPAGVDTDHRRRRGDPHHRETDTADGLAPRAIATTTAIAHAHTHDQGRHRGGDDHTHILRARDRDRRSGEEVDIGAVTARHLLPQVEGEGGEAPATRAILAIVVGVGVRAAVGVDMGEGDEVRDMGVII